MAALALLVGCSDSGRRPRRTRVQDHTTECGDGWVCGNDDFEKVCAKAYDNINGVTADKIVIGNSSGHDTGGAMPVSLSIVNGVQAYMKYLNEQQNGVNGRKIELDLRDNGYDGDQGRRADRGHDHQVNGSRKVFAIVGNGGTPPAADRATRWPTPTGPSSSAR